MDYLASGVGIVKGADTDFGMDDHQPCHICGELVDLTTPITFIVQDEPTGHTVTETMTEANARQLMLQVGVIPPPVTCNKHEEPE